MHKIDKRRAIRNHKTAKDKELLRLEEELNQLWKLRRNLPAKPLPEPIQSGYKRRLVLRSDVKNRMDAPIIEEVLSKINRTEYCRNEKFEFTSYEVKKVKNHRGKERTRYITTKPTYRPHHIYPMSKDWFESKELGWDERHKKYFFFGTRYPAPGFKHGPYAYTGYWFREDFRWMFEDHIEPHYLTHYTEPDSDLETRTKELYAKLWDNYSALGRLNKLHGIRNRRYYDDWYNRPNGERSFEAFCSMMEELEEYENLDYEWRTRKR